MYWGGYWATSQTIVHSEIVKIEQWKLVLGSGNLTVIKAKDGTVTADGDWTYTYQGQQVSGTYTNALVTIAGASISITASGTATNPSAFPGYQTSPFTFSSNGRACNGQGSGTFVITFTAYGWPSSISGTWKGSRTFGSGITAAAIPWIQLLLLDD